MVPHRSQPDPPFPRDLFEGTAEYYVKYRIPYPSVMIEDLAARAGLTGTGRLLDLGSGPGRVAVPMARFFDEVVAVDQEPQMVDAGMEECERSGVRNVHWEVGRAEDYETPAGSFEMITFGDAFHRMDRQLLAGRAFEWLAPGSYLALMGCSSVWSGQEAWQSCAVDVIARWTGRSHAGRGRTGPRTGASARGILREAGFVDVANHRFPVEHTWSIDSFIGYLHSTSVASTRVLGSNVEAFRADLRRALLDCDPRGCYAETVDFFYDLARRPGLRRSARRERDR